MKFDDWNENPETLDERRKAAMHTIGKLAKWAHCDHDQASHVNQFSETIAKAAESGRVPDFVIRRPKYQESHGATKDYSWQIFASTMCGVAWLDRDELEEALAERRHELENGVGMPSATDGSKGQWRSAKVSTIRTLEWLLGEYEPKYPDGVEIAVDV